MLTMRKSLLLIPMLFAGAFAVGNFYGSAPANAQVVVGPTIPGVGTCPGGGRPICVQCWKSVCVDACKGAYYCEKNGKKCDNVGVTCGQRGGLF